MSQVFMKFCDYFWHFLDQFCHFRVFAIFAKNLVFIFAFRKNQNMQKMAKCSKGFSLIFGLFWWFFKVEYWKIIQMGFGTLLTKWILIISGLAVTDYISCDLGAKTPKKNFSQKWNFGKNLCKKWTLGSFD